MFYFLQNLYPDFAQIPGRFNFTKNYIKYGITTKIKMWVEGAFGKLNDTRPNAFLGNTSTLLGLLEGILVRDVGIYDGMSAEIIGPDGEPDYGLAQDMIMKTHMLKQEMLVHRQITEEYLKMTNVTAVLYNMLRMYYIRAYKDLSYKPGDLFYDNGHVSITNQQAFGNFDSAKLGHAVKILDAEVMPQYRRSHFDYPEDGAIYYNLGPYVDGITVSVLRYAHAEWQQVAPYGLTHSSPQLSNGFFIVNGMIRGETVSFEHMAASAIKGAIRDFVDKQHAYRDFEIAYGMLAGTLMRPVPRSAEAIVWNQSAARVYMAKPTCLVGLFPEFYSGTRYTRGPEWQDTYSSWYGSEGAIVAHSIALTEAVYCELFHMARAEEQGAVTVNNFMVASTGDTAVPETGVLVDLTLACIRYGKDCDVRYKTRSGIDRLSTIPRTFVQPPKVTVKDPEAVDYYDLGEITAGVAPLNVADYVPLTYPSLSYGVNEDEFYLNMAKAQVTTEIYERQGMMTFTDPGNFSNFMSMMRLFGYDVKAFNVTAQKYITNWADNSSGRFIYTHDAEDLLAKFVIKLSDITKRDNHWLELPPLYGTTTFGYELEGRQLVWFSGDKKVDMGPLVAKVINRTAYAQAVARLIQATPTVKIIPVVRERTDFHRTVYGLPSSRPTLVPISVERRAGPTEIQTIELDDPGPVIMPAEM